MRRAIITTLSALCLLATVEGQTQRERARESKRSAELMADLADLSTGNAKARAAIRVAAEKKYPDVVALGLKSSNYDVRVDSIGALKTFPPEQQRSALLSALRDDGLWVEQHGGDALGGQIVYFEAVVERLKSFGVTVQWQALYSRNARAQIIQRLLATPCLLPKRNQRGQKSSDSTKEVLLCRVLSW